MVKKNTAIGKFSLLNSFLVIKYLLLDFVRGHSGQIRYNLFAIFQEIFLYLLILNILLILVSYDRFRHPK